MDLRVELFFIYAYTVLFSAMLGAMMLTIMPASIEEIRELSPIGGSAFADALILFAYIVIGAVIFIIINRLGFIKYAIRAVEVISIFGGFAIAATIIMEYLGAGISYSEIAGYFIGIVIAARKLLFPMERNNMYGMVVSAVIGALFGIMLGLEAILLFGALMVAYDFIAVFLTKHMMEIAKAVITNNVSMVVTVARPGAEADFRENKDIEKSKRLDLGTGDLFMASAMVVCAMKYGNMVWFALLFSFIGFLATMEALRILRRPIPALPTIVGSITVGIALYVGIGMLGGVPAPLF
jgi:presenilin-like A22 family membrane protease